MGCVNPAKPKPMGHMMEGGTNRFIQTVSSRNQPRGYKKKQSQNEVEIQVLIKNNAHNTHRYDSSFSHYA